MGVIYILLWVFMISILYTYIMYPLILQFFSFFIKDKEAIYIEFNNLPTVTLFITAYNEELYVNQKVLNSNNLNYPKEKISQMWVTDGSTDKTNELLHNYSEVQVLFEPTRNGKIHAMNRGMQFVDSDIVVFSDGNTLLGKDTLLEIANLFQNKKVGCIAGEKRIQLKNKEDAASSGEGIYWKYESWVKHLDAKVGSTIGAAGELFAIRTELFQEVENDTILDDFIISLRIAMKGYKVDYSPKAYAVEKASASVSEEMKRKVRIAAGSIQAMVRLRQLLNPFKFGLLSIQYISHKVFRWIVAPVCLCLLFIASTILVLQLGLISANLYTVIWWIQVAFYIVVFIGYILKNNNTKWKFLFVPYYFFMANYAMWLGFFKYIRGKQSVNWERAKRAQ